MKIKQFKKIGAFVLAGVLGVSMLTGCGTGEDVAGEEKQTIVMGTNAAWPPFEEVVGGEIVGFDPDIAKLIADELGAELEIMDMEFGQLTAAVDTGKIDFIAAGMTVTEERKAQVDFSNAYFQTKQVIIVPETAEDITTADDLVGKTVGVQLSTTGDLFVSGTEGIEVRQYDKAALAVADLSNGKVDAVVVDEVPAQLIAQNYDGVKLLDAPFIEEEYAIAVKKGNQELLDAINKVLAQIQEDGTYDALYKEYFGEVEGE